MAKISLALALLLSSFSTSFSTTFSFNIIGDSTIMFTNDNREFKYYVDEGLEQIICRFYIPGQDLSKMRVGISCEIGNDTLKTGATAMLGFETPEKNTISFLPERLIVQYVRAVNSRAGLSEELPRKYTIKEIKNFLKAAKNFKLTVLQ